MNYKTLLAALAALAIVGCGKSDTADTTTGGTPATTTPDAAKPAGDSLAGTYTATPPGGEAVTLTLTDDGNFDMTTPKGPGKGTYSKEGDKLTLMLVEHDGKPASDDDKKNPLVLTVSADGKTLDAPGDVDFKKE